MCGGMRSPSPNPSPGPACPPGWGRLARALRWKINAAWWLQVLATPLALVSLVLVGLILWARRYWPEQAASWGGVVVAVALVAVVLWAWWRARGRFVDLRGALVRLESRLRLHNRLSAAAAGACAWPAPPEHAAHGIRWAPGQTLLPPLAAAALLAAAWWVPVTAASSHRPTSEPAAWRTTETELETLTRERLADPASLEQTREKIEELRARDPAKWFSHSSLEATDQLREAHLRAGAELRSQLRQAAQGASRLAEGGGALSARARAQAQERFRDSVEAMRAGAMRPPEELLNQLREIDPAQLGNMDPQQLQQMIDELKAMAEGLGRGLGEGGEEGDGEGEGDGDGEGEDGNGDEPGRGGVNRGPGTTTDLYGKERHKADPAKPEALESPDLSRALPGEVLGNSEIERELDRTSPGLRGGGSADTSGGGGATWQESLHPKEQEALKRFFHDPESRP